MVAGNEDLDAFLVRVNRAIEEAQDGNRKALLFIDDVHLLLRVEAEEGSANLLKPGLERGCFQCVCTTTFEEYRKSVHKDAAFERRCTSRSRSAGTQE